MSKSKLCRTCKGAEMREVVTTQQLVVKGVDVEVSGLLHMECPECGARLETPDQLDVNGELVRTAFLEARARHKRDQGLLTGDEIRAFRERFHLTQKDASRLLGGGPVAFAKYEAEDVVQSVAMDNLIRLCAAQPTNMMLLGQLKGITVPREVAAGVQAHFMDQLPTLAPRIQKFLDEEMAKKRHGAQGLSANDHARASSVIRPQVWKRAA